MTIQDIIALAKSGYKKKDIEELLKLEIPEEPEPESPEKDPEHAPEEPEEPEEKDDSIDDKELRIQELEAQIRKLQEANRNKDQSGGSDPEAERKKRMIERAKSFM